MNHVIFQALQGHLSLIHAYYANDSDLIHMTGETVYSWRQKLSALLEADPSRFGTTHPNKYSGYVYDAVWVYALALDTLIKQNQSYIQDIHSERSVNKFVDIIRATDFYGVSGRINFAHGNSRLSNVKVSTFIGKPYRLYWNKLLARTPKKKFWQTSTCSRQYCRFCVNLDLFSVWKSLIFT